MVSNIKTSLSEFRAFLSGVDEDQQYELIAGEIIMSPAPQVPHQRISRKLLFLLRDIIPNGEVWYAPTEVRINDQNVYQPDIFWISSNNDIVETVSGFVGVPDLVIEILSPGTAKYDKQGKFKAYEAAGVHEYWIADPANDLLEVWTLEEDKFNRVGAFSDGDTFQSTVLGKTILLAAIFANPSDSA